MTRDEVSIRRMNIGEEERVCMLARGVFNEFVAPLYSQEGIHEFLRYVEPRVMATRSMTNHFTLLAEEGDNPVGIIELRDYNHVSLLFVVKEAQGRGVARRLLHEALKLCRLGNPDLSDVSVHSSPNAVGAYERLGFRPKGPEKSEHGIRYIPMILRLGK